MDIDAKDFKILLRMFILKRMKEKNIDLKRLSEQTGIDYTGLFRFEKGQRSLSAFSLFKIILVLWDFNFFDLDS